MTELCRTCPCRYGKDDNRFTPDAQCQLRTGYDEPNGPCDASSADYHYGIRTSDECGVLRYTGHIFKHWEFDKAVDCAVAYYKGGCNKVSVDRYEKTSHGEWHYKKSVLVLTTDTEGLVI